MAGQSAIQSESSGASFRASPNVAIIGASGGIGGALVNLLKTDGSFGELLPFSRGSGPGIEDEATVESFAAEAAKVDGVDIVVVATGALHDENGLAPEKRMADLTADNLAQAFAINAIGPALVAKHFLPLLPRHCKTVFIALSARVGSITDNRLGGWASYRASKAALNMLLKTASIEHRRTHPLSVVAGIHPGTVDTRLSKPFQSRLQPGQLFTPHLAAQQIHQVITQLTPADSGGLFAWDGSTIEF